VKKFLVLYKPPVSATEQMANASPEQARAGMEAWMAWVTRAGRAVVDIGAPLGRATAVGGGSGTDKDDNIVGFSILQADSIDAVSRLLEGHPHLKVPGFTIAVLEALPVPGT